MAITDLELADALSAKGEHELATQVLRRSVESQTAPPAPTSESPDPVLLETGVEFRTETNGKGESIVPVAVLARMTNAESIALKRRDAGLYWRSVEELGATRGVVQG
jgi:hypothetical protein